VNAWTPDSWQTKPTAQSVRYPDQAALARVVAEIGRLPPLVTSWEIEGLRNQLAAAARGDAFVLQGGDCAESFDDCSSEAIAAKLKILMQMSLVLVHGTRRPVVRIGRIAGQYAKPRSTDVETKDGVSLAVVPRRQRQPRGRSPRRIARRIRCCCCAATSARR
jgi:3-deoxy-7-phosphoheptulonate synthase